MNLLQLVNKFCAISALPQTVAVISSTDQQIIQIRELIEEELNDLSTRHQWQALRILHEFTAFTEINQGKLSSLAPGYDYILPDTFYEIDRNLPVYGPVSAEEWAQMVTLGQEGPNTVFRIVGGLLYLYPAPSANTKFSFEAGSSWPITDASGRSSSRKPFFTDDNDLYTFKDNLVLNGLRWRWRREKGLDYAELFNTYEYQVKDAIARDGAAPRLSMDSHNSYKKGVFVPIGDWLK